MIRASRYPQAIKTDSDISLHLTIIKIDLCRLALTHLLFKLGLTIRYIGTLVHIAALRSSLSTCMLLILWCGAMVRRLLECGIHGLRRLSQRAVALDVQFLVPAAGCHLNGTRETRQNKLRTQRDRNPAPPRDRAIDTPRGRHPVRLDLAISGGGPPPAPPPPDIHAQMHTPVALALAPIARRRWPPRVLAAPRITQIKLTSPLPGLRSARAAYFFGATRPHISSQASWRVFGRRLRAGPQHPKPTRASSTQADSATAPCTV